MPETPTTTRASIDTLANAVMGAIYSFVGKAAGDLDAGSADDPFISWCQPGIPFEPTDFDFAKHMLVGQGATDDERAADAGNQMTQAAGFSRFVDFVPSVSGVVGGNVQGGVLRPGRAALSEIYKRVLEASQVAELPEPEGLNAKIAALQAEAKPLEEDYQVHQDAYETAKVEYVMARMQASYSATARLEFQAKGPMLKSKVNRTRQAWEVDGNKTTYENLLAEIASLRSKRSPALWRAEALAKYDDLPEGQNATFGEARITLPYPGSFATNTSGWMGFSFSVSDLATSDTSKTSKWEAGGGFGWGSFKLGASGSGSEESKVSVNNTSNFSIKMEVAQVTFLRNWFDPWFLMSEFWRFNPSSIEGQNADVVSDGGMPPKGLLIAYPIGALFVRNVEITLDELKDDNSELVKTLKGEASGGWGFGVINANGKYERDSTVKTHTAHVEDGVLTIAGMSLIGFTHELMGSHLPNPKSGLTWIDGS